MKEQLLNDILMNLLGTNTLGFLISFYIFAFFGQIFSMLIHLGDKVKRVKVKLSFVYWLRDNVIRFFVGLMVIFLVARFAPELSIPFEVNMFGAVILGIGLDQAIIFVRNKTKINWFQKT